MKETLPGQEAGQRYRNSAGRERHRQGAVGYPGGLNVKDATSVGPENALLTVLWVMLLMPNDGP